MKKYFRLQRSYDPGKGQKTIDDLNNILNQVGVSFQVSQNNNGQSLYISVDEERLQNAIKSKAGRPKKHIFDVKKIQQMKENGKTNKQIYEELGMSKSLFYIRMKDCKNKIG